MSFAKLPFMQFWETAKLCGWSWEDWQRTPRIVRDVCWIYGQMEAEGRKLDQDG